MKKLQINKTKKLFYKKWPYKIECKIKGGNRLRYWDTASVINWCAGNVDWRTKYWESPDVNKSELLSFALKIEPLLGKELQTRIEGSNFNIFCADKNLYLEIINQLENWVESVTEPENDTELEFLLKHNGKKVIVNALPWDDFKYKVILKTNLKPDHKKNLVNWLKNYPDDKIKLSNKTEEWLLNKNWYMQDPFFYIADDSMLTFVHLFVGDSVKKVEEFVLRETV